ncbi:MAG: cysteine desulfurase family protein [Longimonas sp.]|uniref:cysteine desulfurase family protein n=1 Tax=Longimonas sp. TaxID=2039626 RepID=UPI003360ACE6
MQTNTPSDTIYLDHAASTPLGEPVLEAMMPYLTTHHGNPSSVHRWGRQARVAVEEARERVARCIGAEPSEVVFTSGATEANNWVLRKRLADAGPGAHLVTSVVEHEAVLEPASDLEAAGHRVTRLVPDRYGRISPDQVEAVLDDDTALVSLMHVNNETGARTDIPAIAEVCHARGVALHSDTVQSMGLLQNDVQALGVDYATISGHKLYGPKGVGALYVRGGHALAPLIEGGSQERDQRGGTENVAGVVGLAAALEQAYERAPDESERLAALQELLMQQLHDALGSSIVCNTPPEADHRAPHIVNVAVPPKNGDRVDGEMLILNLDMKGILASAGSACTSGTLTPSHVLSGIGLDDATAAAAVRFSMGAETTEAHLRHAVEVLHATVDRMQS